MSSFFCTLFIIYRYMAFSVPDEDYEVTQKICMSVYCLNADCYDIII